MSEQPTSPNGEQPTQGYLAGIAAALKQLGKALTGGYWGGV